jgi:hypothetical protein
MILVLAGLFVAHDAIYVAQFGLGDGYARAMSEQGHDAYWVPVSIVLALGVALVLLGSLSAYHRLCRSAADATGIHIEGPSYPAELVRTWLRLFPSVAVSFTVQENIEHVGVGGHLAGLDPLFGPASSLALPVLATATFALAALGALVRWRIRGLEARVDAAARQRFAPVRDIVWPAGWAVVAASVAHRWILDRRDAGRAPPSRLHSVISQTA